MALAQERGPRKIDRKIDGRGRSAHDLGWMEPQPHRRLGGRLAATMAAASVCYAASVVAAPPTLDEVLSRLDTYLIAYEQRLSSLVAEEHYEQWFRNGRGPADPKGRSLTSDFVFAQLPGSAPWLGFRDTFVVDGRPVREHDARVQRQLAEGSEDALEQAALIVEENARYNLADNVVHRTINVPTLTLHLLHPRYRSRFSYRKAGEGGIEGQRVWKIDFRESVLPPLIKTPRGSNQLSRGSMWVNPGSWAVGRTILTVAADTPRDTSRAQIAVDFRQDAGVGFLVPFEMREYYSIARTRAITRIDGVATYSNFRRFQTSARIVEK